MTPIARRHIREIREAITICAMRASAPDGRALAAAGIPTRPDHGSELAHDIAEAALHESIHRFEVSRRKGGRRLSWRQQWADAECILREVQS